MNLDISEGGVKYVDENNDLWLEEYAVLPPPHVLNGFITILFGIHEFHRTTNNKQSLKLWNDGLKTLKNNLEKYDAGYWSYYDLQDKYPATYKYHTLHVRQLKILYDLTGEKIFDDYAKKWEKYKEKWISKKHADITRNILTIKKYGIKNSVSRFLTRRKWQKNTDGETENI